MKKANLALISSLFLFIFINASLAEAGCINVTVVYYCDDCPRSGADVLIYNYPNPGGDYWLGITNEDGKIKRCDHTVVEGDYSIYALWPDPYTQFGPDTYLPVNAEGNGIATIKKDWPPEECNYPNGTESCGDNECNGYRYCYGGNPPYIQCDSWNTECDTLGCCQCDGGTYINPTQNYDETQNEDCNSFDIATCFNIPDGYDFTWDFRDSQCTALDNCSQGTIIHTCDPLNCGAECIDSFDCVNKCGSETRYYNGGCTATCTCSYITEDCNNHDCSTNLKCVGVETESIKETGDDYTCSGGECSVLETKDCNGPWICDAGSECSSQTCGGTSYKCYYGSNYKWNNSPIIETSCSDGHDNDCDELTDCYDLNDCLGQQGPGGAICCQEDSDCTVGICRTDYTCGVWEEIYQGEEAYPIIDIEVYDDGSGEKIYFAQSDLKIHIFDGTVWSSIQPPVSVPSLQKFNGKLYIAGGPGKIYSYDGTTPTEVFSIDEPWSVEYLKMLGIYNGRLYAGSFLDYPALLYYSTDGTTWIQDTDFNATLNCAPPFCSINSMEVYNGKIYLSVTGSAFGGGSIYVYDGSWSILPDTPTDVHSYMDMKVFNENLYLATRDSPHRCPIYDKENDYTGFCGRVFEFDGINPPTVSFDYIGSLGNGYWIFSLEEYNGRLYAGTDGKIFMWNGTGNWEVSIEKIFYTVPGQSYSDGYSTPAMVLKTWNDRIYAGWGNGIIYKDDMIVLEPPKPDLIIEDIWTSGSTIYYKITNQGNKNSDTYTYSTVNIDRSTRYDYVPAMAPNTSRTEYLTGWYCSGTTDTIKICADGYRNLVDESDEDNNCFNKTFECPVSCTCTAWTNTWELCYQTWRYGCYYRYERTCNPPGCNPESKCVYSRFCMV